MSKETVVGASYEPSGGRRWWTNPQYLKTA